MKNSFNVITLLLCLLHFSISKENVNRKVKSSRTHSNSKFGKYPSGGLISFDSDQDKLSVRFNKQLLINMIKHKYSKQNFLIDKRKN